MQLAARKVVQDNVRLRSLLALHGVSSEQIESFLRSSDNASTSEVSRPSLQEPSTTHQPMAPEKKGDDLFGLADSLPQIYSRFDGSKHNKKDSQLGLDTPGIQSTQHLGSPRPSDSIVRIGIPPPETAADCDTTQGHHRSTDCDYPCPVTELSECPTSMNCFCPPPLLGEHHPASSKLEMSCEAAATIIVEMRGDGDQDSVRASLGCHDQETCTVKNSTVLQVMDEG